MLKTTKPSLLLLPFLLFVALLLAPSTAMARTVKVFVIGNSFSGNATQFLPRLAREGGHELILGRAELSGHSLKQHWSYVEAAEANPEDPKGKPYGGKSLRERLAADTWDIVTIQQYSRLSSDIGTYRPYAQKLVDFIKKLQPQAEIVVHQTWAYRSDSKAFGQVAAGRSAKDQREMYEKSHEAYGTIAKELGARIIPVGDAFWTVTSDPQWAYKPDPNFNFKTPVPPALPDQTNSLNVGYSWKKDTLAFDSNHANAAGCYLGALVWYGFLFNESPEKLTFAPPSVPADFAAHLRKVAWQTLAKP